MVGEGKGREWRGGNGREDRASHIQPPPLASQNLGPAVKMATTV